MFKIKDGLLMFSPDFVNISEPRDFFVNLVHILVNSQM